MTPLNDVRQINIPLKNGVLEFIVKFTSFKGQPRPFIIRRLKLGTPNPSMHTELHTLINSRQELADWILKDEYSALHPEHFKQLEMLCGPNLP